MCGEKNIWRKRSMKDLLKILIALLAMAAGFWCYNNELLAPAKRKKN